MDTLSEIFMTAHMLRICLKPPRIEYQNVPQAICFFLNDGTFLKFRLRAQQAKTTDYGTVWFNSQ